MRHSTLQNLEVDDGRSVLSSSSLGSHSSETIKHSTNTLQAQLKNRKFTAALGRVGHAKEARDAVAKLINRRSPPISLPLDFEAFVTEFNAELETDALRDLVVFPRDDMMLCKPCKKEICAAEKVAEYFQRPSDWGLVREAVQHFSTPCSVIKFNYESFFGDCEKYLANSGLEELVFETEDLIEVLKEKDKAPIGKIKEGHLLIELKGECNKVFKGRKRRFCSLKRTVDNDVVFEVSKQKDGPKASFAIRSAHLKTFNKQRTNVLQLIPTGKDPPGEILAFEAEAGSIVDWFQSVDLAIKSLSAEDAEKSAEPSLAETINESLKSSGSSGDHVSRASLRQKNSVESLLRPPTVKRKNVFSLYENVEPLTRPPGEATAILEDPDDDYQPCTVDFTLLNADPKATLDGAANQICHSVRRHRESVDLKITSMKLTVATDSDFQHIEPFFVTVFFFDVETGERLSNELSFTLANEEYGKIIMHSEKNGEKNNVFSTENLNWEATLKLEKLPKSAHIVARVERILSGVPSDVYFKSTLDKKTLAKHQKVLTNAFNKLGYCRTLIGWAARPVHSSENGLLSIYRHEGRLNDTDWKRLLGDSQKLLKAGKLTPFPNAQLGLSVEVRSENVDLPLKSLDPLIATDFYSTDRLQFDAFADTDGHRQCKNWLFVYPTGLNYGSQKSFSRARNLLCTVRFVRQTNPQEQFVDLGRGRVVSEQHCSIQYHDTNPNFFNEIKLELPMDLGENDHLVFEFSHISLTAAQKTGDEPVSHKAGVAWLQLIKQDKSLVLTNDNEEFELPVAANLPPDYFKLDPPTPNRKSSDSTLKWVEGGRPLFKVKLRLQSSLFSSTPALSKFFQQCINPNQPTLIVKPDLLLQVPFERLQPHLFVVLSSLLQLFTKASDLSSASILSTLVGVLENATINEKKSELREFIRFHLAVGGEFEVDCRALYEGLLEAIGILLSSSLTEQSVIVSTLSHLWFLVDVTVKSMTQTILTNGSHKYSRRRRFSQLTLEAIDGTFLSVSQQILQNHQRFPTETRSANLALAYLAKHCLNIADRGAIYSSLFEIVKRYDTNEVGLARHFKLDFMQVLVGHEHWLPLNLPMLFDSNNKPLLGLAGTKIEDYAQDAIRVAKTSLKTTNILSRLLFQFLPSPLTQTTQNKKTCLNSDHFKLSKTFCSTHFLVGLLLQEFVAALHESRAYRRLVIAMLRNLLMKHSLDLRYDGASQGRIAVLYAPFVQILIEHVDEFEVFGKLEEPEKAEERKENTAFDYAQSTARSILSKDCSSTLNGNSGRVQNNNNKTSQFTEKLDLNEARDLILCALYILNNLPKQVTVSLAFNQQTSEKFDKKEDDFLSMINLLKVSLTLFRCQNQLKTNGYPSLHVKYPTFPSKEQKTLSTKQLKKIFIQESHLSQEVALIVLDVAHNLAEFVAGRWNGNQLDPEQERKAFLGIVELILDLVGDQWPEAVRLNALNTLGTFIELFAEQLSSNTSNEVIPKLCQRLLLLLNSRLEKVQCASAAILHLLIRQGFNTTFEGYASKVDNQPSSVRLPNEGKASADWLGNAGLQITIALAYLLGQNELSADSPRFEHGIHLFESLTANQLDQKLDLFKRSAQDLATQLKDITKATMSITEARNDPVRLAELHVKLADSYRGSPALRAAWFDTLAQIHRADHWFSEAAVCHAHCVAIIAKQLKARENVDIDLSLLSCLNSQILDDERVNEAELPLWHSGNFTIDAFTSKVEETVKVLIDAERYEAVGPIYRMAIPLHERAFNNKALTSVYAELHQAYSRAAEIQTSRKRHLGSYFRVVLHSPIHFGDQHQSAWIYKEPALTSLAEESERMVRLFRKILRTDSVRFLTDTELSTDLDPTIAHIQLTHVNPLLGEQDEEKVDFSRHLKQTDSVDVNYSAHTDINYFYFEKPLVESVSEESNEKVPEQARLALKRVFLKTQQAFPNTRRRLPIVKISEEILSPLELACENLIKKASQIQQVLSTAGIGATGPVDRSKLQSLDMKGLQCLLQGSVSPTVNVGVLAYAEAFTSDSQRSKYGVDGIERLKRSFKIFMAQLARALMVNELAVGEDQAEYQIMLKNSFDGMLERLCTFFDGENFLPDNANPFITKPKNESNDTIPPKSSYILDSISGIPHR